MVPKKLCSQSFCPRSGVMLSLLILTLLVGIHNATMSITYCTANFKMSELFSMRFSFMLIAFLFMSESAHTGMQYLIFNLPFVSFDGEFFRIYVLFSEIGKNSSEVHHHFTIKLWITLSERASIRPLAKKPMPLTSQHINTLVSLLSTRGTATFKYNLTYSTCQGCVNSLCCKSTRKCKLTRTKTGQVLHFVSFPCGREWEEA